MPCINVFNNEPFFKSDEIRFDLYYSNENKKSN